VGIAAGGQHNLALRRDGTAVAWGDGSSGQTDIPTDATNLIAVATGEKHSLGLRADDTVVAWGDNSYGQASVPPAASNVVAIAAGKTHSLALRADGTVVAWGGDSSQRNTPATISNAVAIAAGGFYSLALQLNGSVVGWGGSSRVPAGMSDGMAVSAGGTHALTLTASGSLLAGGAGITGRLRCRILPARCRRLGRRGPQPGSPGRRHRCGLGWKLFRSGGRSRCSVWSAHYQRGRGAQSGPHRHKFRSPVAFMYSDLSRGRGFYAEDQRAQWQGMGLGLWLVEPG